MARTQKRRLGIPDLLADRREEILKLAERHGAYNVRVFGSVVRGEANDDSDIDFLVDWDYERISAWGGAGLMIELEALLGRRVDLVSSKALHPLLRDRILREAVPL
jgi:predicted nucleotidyltransferase